MVLKQIIMVSADIINLLLLFLDYNSFALGVIGFFVFAPYFAFVMDCKRMIAVS